MQDLAPLAFADDHGDIRVNFGVFAGREATAAEIDELARTLLDEVDVVTIVAEHRYIVDRETEASVHQIKIELGGADPAVPLRLTEQWARACIADRAVEIEAD